MSEPVPVTDRATNWRACNAALRQRGSLVIWFDPRMEWLAAPRGGRGRASRPVRDAAIQTCLTRDGRCSDCRRGRSSHRGAIGSSPMARGAGGEPHRAGASGLAKARLQHLGPTLERADRPDPMPSEHGGGSHLLIDSTGIKAAGEGEWSTRKHGASRPRSWRKVHPGIDAETLEVRAIEITGSRIGDSPMLPDLLAQIPTEEPIGQVTADGAHDTRPCHAAIAARPASAAIPTRRDGRRRTGDHARLPGPP